MSWKDVVLLKKIDPKVKERCVQQMLDQVAEYPNPTPAAQVLAKHNEVGARSVRRWYSQAQVYSGQRHGASSEELAEIKNLKAKVRLLEEGNVIIAEIFRISLRQDIHPSSGTHGTTDRMSPAHAAVPCLTLCKSATPQIWRSRY